MKKRILASTMASVMALSAAGTSLVSFADIDAAYKKIESVDKATLSRFMKTDRIKSLGEDGKIDDYGSVSGERFMAAYQYAEAVLADSESTEADYTAAFQMLKATEAELKEYDNVKLSELVETCRPTYNTENRLNPNSDNEDTKYDDTKWSDFVSAFENAEGYVDYVGDIRITTDAYEELQDAYDKVLKAEKKIKTKQEIEKAMKNYEAALNKEFEYQPWQRGTIKNVSNSTYKDKDVSWGAIYAHVQSGQSALVTQYKRFTDIKGITKTSDKDIVGAVNAMVLAADILNGFTAKPMKSATQRNITTLIADYQGQLVYNYNSDMAEAVFADFVAKATSVPEFKKNGEWKATSTAVVESKSTYWNVEESTSTTFKALGVSTSTTTKTLSAELRVRSQCSAVYYIVDTSVTLLNGKNPIVPINNGVYFATGTAPVKYWNGSAQANLDATKHKVVNVAKKNEIVISDLIPVGADEIIIEKDAAVISARNDYNTALSGFEEAKEELTTFIAENLYNETSNGTKSGKLNDDKVKLENWKAALTGDTVTAVFAGVTADATAWTSAVNSLVGDIDTLISTYEAKIDLAVAGTITADDLDACVIGSLDLPAVTTAAGFSKDYTSDLASITAAAKPTLTDYANAVAPATTSLKAQLTSKAGDVPDLDTAKAAIATAKAGVDTSAADTLALSNNVKNNVFDKASEVSLGSNGLCKSSDFGTVASSFDVTTAYSSSKTGNEGGNISSITNVSLARALELVAAFNDGYAHGGENLYSGEWVDIKDFDNKNDIVSPDSNKKPSSPAAKLLYNYLEYALEDEFKADAGKTYTKKDVEDLIEKAYALTEKAMLTSMFTDSNKNLVVIRDTANEWVRIANSNRRTYANYKTSYTVNGNPYTSTTMYTALESKYNQLKKEVDAFEYDYGTIVDKMGEIAKAVDGDKLTASQKDTINKAMAKVALDMTKLTILKLDGNDFDESVEFNDDGSLNRLNRVLTNKDGVDIIYGGTSKPVASNSTHTDLTNDYRALVKAYEDATKAPDKPALIYNVDGQNGDKADVRDVAALLTIVLEGKNKTNLAYDFDGSNEVDINDCAALLAEALKG